jgi:hypothetical protein
MHVIQIYASHDRSGHTDITGILHHILSDVALQQVIDPYMPPFDDLSGHRLI